MMPMDVWAAFWGAWDAVSPVFGAAVAGKMGAGGFSVMVFPQTGHWDCMPAQASSQVNS
ncbi:MAG: hypothetical protein II943_04540 [Victivallales bacterium]|nr:hypothetical protein [Victivallales bacterium]